MGPSVAFHSSEWDSELQELEASELDFDTEHRLEIQSDIIDEGIRISEAWYGGFIEQDDFSSVDGVHPHRDTVSSQELTVLDEISHLTFVVSYTVREVLKEEELRFMLALVISVVVVNIEKSDATVRNIGTVLAYVYWVLLTISYMISDGPSD